MDSIINSIFTNIFPIYNQNNDSGYSTNNYESIFDYTNNDTKIIAHRGDSDDAPENTLPAYISAVENGYKIAECDVRWTKDDIPVLLHDRTINRTARTKNGLLLVLPRYCSNMNLEDIQKYDFGSWFDDSYKDTNIATFEQTLKYAKENNLQLYIDLKKTKDFDSTKAQILTQMVKDNNMEDNVSWISFSADYLKEIKNILPNARLGYLSKKKITDKTIKILNELKSDSNEVFLDIKYTKITKNGIEKLNQAGFSYEAWTVDDANIANQIIEKGCSGITTDKLNGNDIN